MSEDRARSGAHEAWAMAQLGPGEGIEDAVERLAAFLATLASEREAIGRAAGREEAAKVAETCAQADRDHGFPPDRALDIAAAIRALPVDGGKDGADG